MTKLVLPLPDNLANSRMHWRKKGSTKELYFLQCTAADNPKRPRTPPAKVRITATVYTWNPMDADNLMARMKWPLDWMKKRGWITDDGPKHLEWAGIPAQAIDRKNMRIEITLEAL